ncbi:MAG: hypothetical protein HY820_29980 [Acidobacteria bacterium]|nr:hypothetical protein [Acidobacteriota bacterium]
MTPLLESNELLQVMEQLREQISRLTLRVEQLEGVAATPVKAAAPAEGVPAGQAAPAAESAPETLSPETVLVIAAAVAAYLGKRGHIRHIRLLTSTPWAQQGRVSIQASHQLDTYHG